MKGDGNITQRGRNIWRVRVEAPAAPDGKRRWVSRTVHGTKADASARSRWPG